MESKANGALVTGGGTGTGRAIALRLREEGFRVGITGRRAEVIEETVAIAESSGTDGEPIVWQTADVSDREDVARLFKWAAAEIGPVQILVNSAGINVKGRRVSDLTPEDFDRIVDINCTGAFNTIWAVLPQMRERSDGVIININSIAGLRSSELSGVAYATSKFAMTALARGVANEEGKNGIRVTTIFPGEINTPILEQRPEPVSDERKATLLQPEDFSDLVAVLAKLPPHAHISEVVIKPTHQKFA